MANANVDRFLQITLTQGGADAFVESSVATEIIPADGEGFLLTLVEVYFALSGLEQISADSYLEWAVTRDTKAAMPLFSDTDVILVDGFANALTTSGEVIIKGRYDWVPPPGTILVEPLIYAQLDSGGTGQANTCYMRLHYQAVKLTEVEILRLLNG